MTRLRRIQFTQLVAGIVGTWFLLMLAASWLGVFSDPQRPPLLIGAAAVLPVVLLLAWYVYSAEFRQFLSELDLRFLTLVQTGRIAGVLFVMLYSRGLLPAMFALPAGWGDIIIGITAPLAAWTITAVKDFRKELFVWWNVLGTFDLVMAVTLGILASGAFSAFAGGAVTTELMGRFPLSLVPTFLVPLYLILHFISLSRVFVSDPDTAQRI